MIRIPFFGELALGLVSAVSANLSYADATTHLRPLDVVVIGDSITVALLGDTSAGNRESIKDPVGKIFKDLILGTFSSEDPYDEGALNRGKMERAHRLAARPELSAITGSGDYSLATKLIGAGYFPINFVNLARPGLSFRQIPDRLNTHLSAVKQHRYADLVIVNVGANDFFFGESLQTVKTNVQTSLMRVAESFPEAMLLVLGIPDIAALLAEAPQLAGRVNSQGKTTRTCAQIMQSDKVGEKIGIAHLGAGAAINQALRARQKALVEVFENGVRFIRIIKDNLRFRGEIHFVGINMQSGQGFAGLLAEDCLHPNIKGLQGIGDSIWEGSRQHLTRLPLFHK